jgi:hypothetical protein
MSDDDPKLRLVSAYHGLVIPSLVTAFHGASGQVEYTIDRARDHEFIDLWKLINEADDPPPPPPPPQLANLELDAYPIVFGGGVPVGGSSHLSLFPDGSYSFTGHFHDSGWPSYDVGFVWVLRSSAGSVFTFSKSGRCHGTGESGSRNFDWGDNGNAGALAQAWPAISAGYSWSWHATANGDIGGMIDSAVKAIGQAAAIIAIVA